MAEIEDIDPAAEPIGAAVLAFLIIDSEIEPLSICLWFNSVHQTLSVTMPTRLHDCLQIWLVH